MMAFFCFASILEVNDLLFVAEEFVNMKFQMPDVTATLEGISSLMENDIEKKVEVRN
jgi:hypothetical protein